ncbi:MAG TPA: tRNA (adenosine(37)-N6)-dimethylallyltransferase MiaA [Arthrobacter sp.]|nr:tRNA (adenosine(37)-N6)-dimethylallyltransferase MiaA [Arthrobacter sp.]
MDDGGYPVSSGGSGPAAEAGRRQPVVAVVGPTGSGKSELGVRLAQQLGGEIINADAMQFYRGMDIGTAKLPPWERGGIEHHMLDILDVTEEASVSAYQQQARSVIDDIRTRGAVPILVGGSGLYVRAVLDVLEFPGTSPAVRAGLEDELARRGPEPLRQRLENVDPVSAQRVRDDRRLIRALEVFEVTGRPFSSFMPERTYYQPALQLGLEVDRDQLRQQLADRVDRMVHAGLEAEVADLVAHGLRQGKTASRALGYAQFLQVLDGMISAEEATAETVAATRKFARRQRTWFGADPRIKWLPWKDADLVEQAMDYTTRTLEP